MSGRHVAVKGAVVEIELLPGRTDDATPEIARERKGLTLNGRELDRDDRVAFADVADDAARTARHRRMDGVSREEIAADRVRTVCRNRADRIARIKVLDRRRDVLLLEMRRDAVLEKDADVLLEDVTARILFARAGDEILSRTLGDDNDRMALADRERQQQLLRDAIEQYKQALRLNPRDNDTRYNLALCQKQLKDSQQSQQQKEKKDKQQPQPQQKQQQQQQQEQTQQQPQPSKSDREQNERYANLAKQAEQKALQKINNRQPRQRTLNKNW